MAWTYFVVGSGSIGRRHFANLQAMGKSTELLSWRHLGAAGVDQKLTACNGMAAVVIAVIGTIRSTCIGEPKLMTGKMF